MPEAGGRTYGPVVRVAQHSEARAVISRSPDAIAVVARGALRSTLFACPCRCGDVLVVNLDRGAGPAWRARLDATGLTLLPSVWRTTGCRSHFVLWRSRVWWCATDDADSEDLASDAAGWPSEMDDALRAEWKRIGAERRPR